MKIALIAPTSIPARRANTIQVMKMAQALTELGHTVQVLAPRDKLHSPPVAWENLAKQYGLRTSFPIDWLPARPSLRRYDYSLQALVYARRLKADVIYTRLPQAAALGSLLGLATILEIHDLPQGTAGPILFQAFLKGRGKRQMVVITRALADDLHARFNAPLPNMDHDSFTLVAPDGVDVERYEALPAPEAARRTLSLEPETFTAGYTGHLYAGRGADLLLELAGRLPQVQFLLAGGEPADVERLRADAARRGLANLILAGFVPNAELPCYQAACDALLMPYGQQVAASSGGDIARYLSPMKLFEYLACGRAILSSDLPVLREVLNPANAVLLPPHDVTAWAEALLRLRDDPALRQRLGQQARSDAQNYTWTARAGRIFGHSTSSPEA